MASTVAAAAAVEQELLSFLQITCISDPSCFFLPEILVARAATTCPRCFTSPIATGDSRLPTIQEWRNHLLIHDAQQDVHTCPYCPMVFAQGRRTADHRRTHLRAVHKSFLNNSTSGHFLYRCIVCPDVCVETLPGLKKHILSVHVKGVKAKNPLTIAQVRSAKQKWQELRQALPPLAPSLPPPPLPQPPITTAGLSGPSPPISNTSSTSNDATADTCFAEMDFCELFSLPPPLSISDGHDDDATAMAVGAETNFEDEISNCFS